MSKRERDEHRRKQPEQRSRSQAVFKFSQAYDEESKEEEKD